MKEQPHYLNLLTKEFFENYYLKQKMSFPKIAKMLSEQGYNVAIGTIHKYYKKLKLETRDHSESRRILFKNYLDYNKSYLTEDIIEAIDGFLLGDGGINYGKISRIKAARFQCGVEHEEFCKYLMKFFEKYNMSVTKTKDLSMKQGYHYSGRTRDHPDIYKQYIRWYPEVSKKRYKQPPDDVRITPLSVMMWYLGDGSVVYSNDTIVLRLSTDGFLKEKVEILVDKLNKLGILCIRTNENRIYLKAKGVPVFFNFIGTKSPIKCYNYKFDRVPKWRFEAKRMKDVAKELNVSYNRLSYMIKTGHLSCYRASPNGKPRFLSEHIEEAKKLIELKLLY